MSLIFWVNQSFLPTQLPWATKKVTTFSPPHQIRTATQRRSPRLRPPLPLVQTHQTSRRASSETYSLQRCAVQPTQRRLKRQTSPNRTPTSMSMLLQHRKKKLTLMAMVMTMVCLLQLLQRLQAWHRIKKQGTSRRTSWVKSTKTSLQKKWTKVKQGAQQSRRKTLMELVCVTHQSQRMYRFSRQLLTVQSR